MGRVWGLKWACHGFCGAEALGPWHEVRHAIAARGEARPLAGGPAGSRPTGDGQPYPRSMQVEPLIG